MLATIAIALLQAAAGDHSPPAAATQAESPALQAQAQPTAEPARPAVVHCRTMRQTGSHIPVRVCSSEAEDRAMSERTGDELRRRAPAAMTPENIQAAGRSH